MDESHEVMDCREACAYLGVSRDTLYKYAIGKQVPAFKMGNRWKFKKSVLDCWMDQKSSAHRRASAVTTRGRVPISVEKAKA